MWTKRLGAVFVRGEFYPVDLGLSLQPAVNCLPYFNAVFSSCPSAKLLLKSRTVLPSCY